jgi:L-Ala-D/L-Glu epimerase
LRFAIESAYIHYFCQKKGITVVEFLGLSLPQAVSTAFSLPIMDPAVVPAFIRDNNLNRFANLKVKVNQEEGLDLVRQVASVNTNPLIVDANEAWANPDELLLFLEQLKRFRIAFIEQPMPAAETEAYTYLRQHTPYDIFADESVTNQADFDLLQKQFHGVNMKLMKAGGYLNALHILEQTRQRGLKTMVGCMIETSLGIWSAMQLCQGVYQADLDGFLILKNEPFGIVEEKNGQLFIT